MAGFTEIKMALPVRGLSVYEFHIGTPNLAQRIKDANNGSRVISMQLDGDELEAALWGLENYKKRPPHTLTEDDGEMMPKVDGEEIR